ncbi:MAG: hypothetical protein Q8P78_03275 [bacterium]|nr:hypothetical protein [bacterium]
MKARIKRIDASLPLPQYETGGAVAFDFVVREDTVIPARGFGRAPANVVVEIPEGYMLWVTDRSGTLKKTGLLITEGVVDRDYCGDSDEILLQFYNPTDAPITIKRGDRVAQGVFLACARFEWEEVSAMNRESRGGFGSTDRAAERAMQAHAPQRIGKLIVLYGINNLGKTTQAKLLVERLRREGFAAEYIKYPIYDLAPTGPMIDEYLRGGNPKQLAVRELQELYTLNRYTYEPELIQKIKSGTIVVAEDYWGTGVSWGTAQGLDKMFLLQLNGALLKEDCAFLFEGDRFLESVEQGHINERNNSLTERSRAVHKELGHEFGWMPVDANKTIEEIQEFIWGRVQSVLQ